MTHVSNMHSPGGWRATSTLLASYATTSTVVHMLPLKMRSDSFGGPNRYRMVAFLWAGTVSRTLTPRSTSALKCKSLDVLLSRYTKWDEGSPIQHAAIAV